jgi:hypothetical protein
MSSEEKKTNRRVCINCRQIIPQNKKSNVQYLRCKPCANAYRKNPCQCIINGRFCAMIALSNHRLNSSYCKYHKFLPSSSELVFGRGRKQTVVYVRFDQKGQQHHFTKLEFSEETATNFFDSSEHEPDIEVNLNSRIPHEILGLPLYATVEDIRKAFRKLSLQFHPDKNLHDHQAHEKFIKIREAYELLTEAA